MGKIRSDLCRTRSSSDSSCFLANDNLCCNSGTWSNLASCLNCSIFELCVGQWFSVGNDIRSSTGLEKKREDRILFSRRIRSRKTVIFFFFFTRRNVRGITIENDKLRCKYLSCCEQNVFVLQTFVLHFILPYIRLAHCFIQDHDG